MLFSIFTKLLNYSPFSCASNPPVLHFAVFLWAGNAVVVLCWGLPSPCSGGSISVFQSPNLTSCFQKGMAFLLSAHTPFIWLMIFTFLKWLSLKMLSDVIFLHLKVILTLTLYLNLYPLFLMKHKTQIDFGVPFLRSISVFMVVYPRSLCRSLHGPVGL